MSEQIPHPPPGEPPNEFQIAPPYIIMGLHPGKTIYAQDSASITNWDLTQIERATAVARLRAMAQMLEDGF